MTGTDAANEGDAIGIPELVVRRALGIPDVVGERAAREEIVRVIQGDASDQDVADVNLALAVELLLRTLADTENQYQFDLCPLGRHRYWSQEDTSERKINVAAFDIRVTAILEPKGGGCGPVLNKLLEFYFTHPFKDSVGPLTGALEAEQ